MSKTAYYNIVIVSLFERLVKWSYDKDEQEQNLFESSNVNLLYNALEFQLRRQFIKRYSEYTNVAVATMRCRRATKHQQMELEFYIFLVGNYISGVLNSSPRNQKYLADMMSSNFDLSVIIMQVIMF